MPKGPGHWREGLSLTEFGRRTGTSINQVNNAISKGTLERLPDGSIDPSWLEKDWRPNNKSHSKKLSDAELYDIEVPVEEREKKHRGRPQKNSRSMSEELETIANDPDREPEEIVSLQAKKLLGFLNHNQAALFKETYLALSRKLEFDKEVRSVCPVSIMQAENARQLSAFRSICDNIAPTVAPMIVGLTNPNEIQAIIQREIDEAYKAMIEV